MRLPPFRPASTNAPPSPPPSPTRTHTRIRPHVIASGRSRGPRPRRDLRSRAPWARTCIVYKLATSPPGDRCIRTDERSGRTGERTRAPSVYVCAPRHPLCAQAQASLTDPPISSHLISRPFFPSGGRQTRCVSTVRARVALSSRARQRGGALHPAAGTTSRRARESCLGAPLPRPRTRRRERAGRPRRRPDRCAK